MSTIIYKTAVPKLNYFKITLANKIAKAFSMLPFESTLKIPPKAPKIISNYIFQLHYYRHLINLPRHP